MIGRPYKALLSWCLALIVAVSCANFITFFYRSGSGSIPRTNAFSSNIRTPNSRIVRGLEGYGVNYADQNGYMNLSDLPLKSDYILFMGSSHLEGLQVMQDQNMVSVLNDMLDEHARTVYNMGTAGYTLPLIVEGFQAGIEEFPDSSAVIIELSQMAYSSDELKSALVQTQYDPSDSGRELVKSQSLSRRIRNAVLSVFPVISQLRQQFESIRFDFDGAFGIQTWYHAEKTSGLRMTDSDDFSGLLNQAFALLRAEYDNPIILLYQPGVSLQRDGTLTIDRDERYYNDYVGACDQNDIIFLDVGDAFLEAYESDYSMAYGFNNTTMGSGHINPLGHRIIAEELYKAILKLQAGGIE